MISAQSKEREFKKLTEGYNLHEFEVSENLFEFINDW